MKTVRELISATEGIHITGAENRLVAGLYMDSREVKPDALFCAMPGLHFDGQNYIDQAIKAGATVVLCRQLPESIHPDVTYLQTSDIRNALGSIASSFYEHPSRQLKLIAVTGTNGKTSIVTWLYHLTRSLGYAAGLLSTVRILIEERPYPASHTTPDVISINHYLAEMVRQGCSYAFMEASSHALDQQRTAGLRFEGAVFTNITRDHLDYHNDFSDYISAKKSLFDALLPEAFALSNADDRNGKLMLQNCAAQHYFYSIQRPGDFRARVLEQHPDGMLLDLDQQEVWVPVIGDYNASNMAAVYGVARLLSHDRQEVLQAVSTLKPVEGRLEIIPLGNSITGVVDYAHTPDALKNVLSALNGVKKAGGRIITVVGAGGDRDPGKRPHMTQAAMNGSDQVILTSDNPRTEDPEKILDDMTSGLTPDEEKRVLRITGRLSAIRTAVTLAHPGDIILVAGKGHENYQEIMGVKHPFDDREELKKMKNKE